DPQLRWRFTDIRPDSFIWRGEVSRDGGATWAQDEEMRITRRAATGDALVEALHAPGPAGLHAEELRLFDGFLGSWDTAWTGRDVDGRARSARGAASAARPERRHSTAPGSASSTRPSVHGAEPGWPRSTATSCASSYGRPATRS